MSLPDMGNPLGLDSSGPAAVALFWWLLTRFLLKLANGIPNEIFKTYTRRFLSTITHLMLSIVQFEHLATPSAVVWYLCITSQRTLLARQAAQALPSFLLSGLDALRLLSPAEFELCLVKFESLDAGHCSTPCSLLMGITLGSKSHEIMMSLVWLQETSICKKRIQLQSSTVGVLNRVSQSCSKDHVNAGYLLTH